MPINEGSSTRILIKKKHESRLIPHKTRLKSHDNYWWIPHETRLKPNIK